MKKGFIFDLDGVITDTAKYHYLAWKALANTLNIDFDLTFNEQLKGISRMDSLNRILAYGQQENRYSDSEKETFAQQKNAHYVTLLQALTPDDLLPGVKDFLVQARERQIPCAIASASKNAPYILEKLAVADYFAAIVDPATLQQGKPDPEIFFSAAALLNITPQEAVGFEDAQAGIDGLKAADIYTVGIQVNEPLQHANLVVTTFEDLNIDDLLSS